MVFVFPFWKPGMSSCTWFALLLVCIAAACSSPAADQAGPPTVVLGAPLDSVTDLDAPEVALEVAPGIVVLPAPTLPGLIRLHLANGTRDSVGRAGDRPGEFRSPFFAQSVNAREILVLDGLARRLLRFDRALSFREQFNPPSELPPFTLRYDSLGSAYSVASAAGPFREGDSLAILRRRTNGGSIDTIAFVRRLRLHGLEFANTMMMVPAEYAPRDLWGVLLDGTVWIGRGSLRELEFIAPDGARRVVPLLFEPIATVEADRALFRGFPAPEAVRTVTRVIAPNKGPFQEIRADDAGHLFLWLNQPAGYSRELVAEFGAEGELLRTIALPLGSKIVAVSETHVYTTQESPDGTWVLRRHPRPS